MGDELLVYMNGRFVPESQATVSVYDHGFLYGDGVFEGIRAYNGRVFRLDEHVSRMFRSAEKIGLKVSVTESEFRESILETCRKNKLKDAYLRPIFTRGKGDLGINPKTCRDSSVIIIAKPFDPMYKDKVEAGLKLVTSKYLRTPPESLNPNIKSLNYLNNIMAKMEAANSGVDEALMLDRNGFISEATAENVFIIKDGVLITPPTETILEGVTRACVIDLAREMKMKVEQRKFKINEVYSADEMFLTGTAAEIAPVAEVDGKKIGTGKPGSTTKKLMEAFAKYARSTGTEIYK